MSQRNKIQQLIYQTHDHMKEQKNGGDSHNQIAARQGRFQCKM